MIVLDQPLVITDTETTGLSPARNRIIEIAATKVQDGQDPISYSQLVDPGVSIPYRITRLTGITSAMVVGSPDASEAIPSYTDFLADGILVAHNLAFDRGFLNAERDRLGLGPLQNPGLCTAKLARRLLPGLRSKSLDSLSKFFRIAAHGRHRALRDVEITWEILQRLVDIASRDHQVDSLEGLMDMQSKTYARINPFSQHIVQIRRDILPNVPHTPGIYKMLNGRGQILYVGKAKNLANRVRSYFNAIEAHTPRIRQLVAKIREIKWEERETELEALLLESKLIRELDPPFNRAQRKTIPRPYLRIATDHPFPRVVANVFPKDDGAEYYGPLRTRGEAHSILEVVERFFKVRTCSDREYDAGKRCLRADIGRCDAPCEGQIRAQVYAQQIEGIRRFLGGEVGEILSELHDDMAESSKSLAFEEAARVRDLITVLESRIEKSGRIAARIFDDDGAVVHFYTDSDGCDLLLIKAGQFVCSVRGFDPSDPGSLNELDVALSNVFVVEGKPDHSSLRDNANEIRVLINWLYANRHDVVRIERAPYVENDAFVESICDVVRAGRLESAVVD